MDPAVPILAISCALDCPLHRDSARFFFAISAKGTGLGDGSYRLRKDVMSDPSFAWLGWASGRDGLDDSGFSLLIHGEWAKLMTA